MGGGDPLRIGIVGAGFIGAVHARSARLAGGVLVAVAASTPRSSERAARSLGAEKAASAIAVAEDPGIDVLHICAPNHLHVPLARAALAAGKHVICEKPLASSDPRQASSLFLPTVCPIWRRFPSSTATTPWSARPAPASPPAMPARCV